MHAAVLQVADWQLELGAVGAQVGQRDLGRLLHHVAELAGQGESLGSVGNTGFDEEYVAAGAGDCEARRHTGHTGSVRRFEVKPRSAEPLAHVRRVNDNRRFAFTGGKFRRQLAQESSDLALQVPHARLSRVVSRDGPQGLIVDDDFVVAQCCAGQLTSE